MGFVHLYTHTMKIPSLCAMLMIHLKRGEEASMKLRRLRSIVHTNLHALVSVSFLLAIALLLQMALPTA